MKPKEYCELKMKFVLKKMGHVKIVITIKTTATTGMLLIMASPTHL
jgi:hypothetical protein